MDNKSIFEEWMEYVDTDFEVARRIFEEKWPKQHITICYHAQQAAEKSLKAYLGYKNEEIKKTHNLIELNENCEKYDDNFANIIDACIFLNPFATQIRYPKNFYSITDVETKKALDSAKIIIDFVKGKTE